MGARMVAVPCWRVWVWRQGHWMVRSTHDTEAQAREASSQYRARNRFGRSLVRKSTRRVAAYVEAPAPTAAQKFREAQADRMALRRQAHAYFKSGSNGTEVLQLPKEADA
jgi:hypothetical protein